MLEILIAAAIGGFAAPECHVDFERYDESRLVLRIRAACPLGLPSTQAAVREILAQAGDAQELSLSLGRIERYPWLSELLTRSGRPPRGKHNSHVAAALRTIPEFTALFDRWQITGVSVEKVLLNKDGLPYDAILWVRLRRPP